ncbi:SusC/RagA family TonB-linked outer membrane protein [Capnocytophaga sp.]|uniref:SusC/RagA family TonB-linked outer membrane protein n=1 Tax=Capnocytophaga sp. TaxID=44737 RepID=UPI0026DA9658|nr:SusC/RagA family TonB-linked outer membrane protein [Capnocytophaga sp.]MDO5106209.1 SusC/RagA family TonB-linked outer membrane protein [Capnocytophaga sp.]
MKRGLLLLFLLLSAFTWAQKKIEGKVQDPKGVPLMGVNVIVKGTNKGVSSDIDGMFELKIPQEGVIIEFSAIGFKKTEKKVSGKDKFILITMEEDLMEIDEVIVTGYQSVDPTKLATAYTKVEMKDFERKGAPDVISRLEGLSAALVMSANPSNPTGSPEFSIRGVSTLNGGTRPLIVLDGFQYEGKMEDINPYEVESVTLLKDAASAAIYGAKSSNGVIVITTKRGREGKLHIQYTNNYTFQDKMDLGYLVRRPSSSDLVDIQYDIAKNSGDNLYSYRHLYETNPNARFDTKAGSLNRVAYLFAQQKYGYITPQEFEQQINQLRGYDNLRDIENLYLQNPSTNQHNFTVRGGSQAFNYRGTLNYTNSTGNIKGNSNDKLLFDFVTNTVFSPKVDLDFQINMTFNDQKRNNLNHQDSELYSSSLPFTISSYDRFFDENGQPLSVFIPFSRNSKDILFGGKDPYEIERLKQNGLLDETYIPASEFGRYTGINNSWSTRVQGMLNTKLMEGLSLSLGGQLSKGVSRNSFLYDGNSWYIRHIINNTTPLDYFGDPNYLNIPLGARFVETRGESLHYLLRAQLNFQKNIDNHNFNIVLGGEAQENKNQTTTIDHLGYDPRSSLFSIVNKKDITGGFSQTFHPSRDVTGLDFNDFFGESQNRHISAYGNLIYTFNSKYIFSGSIRLDQSNLFGTDPKYRYRPFWSAAFRWRASEENFLKDKNIRLDLRVTYGINGNIANKYGPFDIATQSYIFRAGSISQYITDYKVNDLRWERTATTNIGFDLGLFKDRVEINFDYYRKNTTDILSKLENDPTKGQLLVPANDAEMYNNGFELRLVTQNIKTSNFLWETQLNFTYNQAKTTRVTFDYNKRPYQFAGSLLNIEGQAPRSLYVYQFAGLDNEGYAQIRKLDGSLVKVDITPSANDLLTFDDLKWAGHTIPTHVVSMNNNIAYKGLALSFLMIYQGGHVTLKDTYDGRYLANEIGFIHTDVTRAWKKPGDEAITDIPKIASASYSNIIRGTDKNVIPADFLRLRDVTLSYQIPTQHLAKTPFKALSFNIRANNLWLWTKNNEGIDPERHGLGNRYARTPKSYSMGAVLTF